LVFTVTFKESKEMAAEEVHEKKFKLGELVKIRQPITEKELKDSFWQVQEPKAMNRTVGRIGTVGDRAFVTHPSYPKLYWVKVDGNYHWYNVGILKRAFKGQLSRQEPLPKPEPKAKKKK
jgi:hypothetical protein